MSMFDMPMMDSTKITRYTLEQMQMRTWADKKALEVIQQLRDELTELREFKRKVMELQPVAWLHIQGNYKEASSRPLDTGEVSRGWEERELYDLKGLKC